MSLVTNRLGVRRFSVSSRKMLSSRTVGALAVCALISAVFLVRRKHGFSLESLDEGHRSSAALSQFSGAKWLANEKGLKFSREDGLAKSYLPRAQPIDEALGDLASPDFEIKEVGAAMLFPHPLNLTSLGRLG